MRLCQHYGCLWFGRHMEGCHDCFGWGFVNDGMGWTPVTGGDLGNWSPHWTASQCLICWGTPLGAEDAPPMTGGAA
jgi:hypothetical protein